MKKLFIATMAAAAVFASCSDNGINVIEPIGADSPQVHLTLGTDAATRVFFDNSATAETWESEVTMLSVYIFNNAGNFILKRTLTPAEIANLSARILLPNSTTGTECSFYVVANDDYGSVATTAEMDVLRERATLDEYNGTFAQTAQGRKRSAGFVMTGKTTATIAAAGTTTSVSLSLKRTVAKIAVRTTIDPSLSAMYGGGTVIINSVTISKARGVSHSFQKPVFAIGPSLYKHTQTPQTTGSNFDALFYVYETAAPAEGNRVMLTLTGYFDADNNPSTTNDRIDVEYTVDISGFGNGAIWRNGYYRINVVITRLSDDGTSGLMMDISVANWENSVTQTAYLGGQVE